MTKGYSFKDPSAAKQADSRQRVSLVFPICLLNMPLCKMPLHLCWDLVRTTPKLETLKQSLGPSPI